MRDVAFIRFVVAHAKVVTTEPSGEALAAQVATKSPATELEATELTVESTLTLAYPPVPGAVKINFWTSMGSVTPDTAWLFAQALGTMPVTCKALMIWCTIG